MSVDGLLLPNDNIISGELKIRPNFKSIVDPVVNKDSNLKDKSSFVTGDKNIQIPTLNIKSKSFFPFTS